MNRRVLTMMLFVGTVFCAPLQAGMRESERRPANIRECDDFLRLTSREQVLFLDGYVDAAAMEMKYLQNNVGATAAREALNGPVGESRADPEMEALVSYARRSIERIDETYALLSIAVRYFNSFHEELIAECKRLPNYMFEAVPITLEKMRDSGDYPAYGM